MANEGDFVKKREDFINPKHFKNYRYSLSGTTKLMNTDVFIINFDTSDDSSRGTEKGKFYVDKASLAYVAFRIEATDKGISNYNRTKLNVPELRKKEAMVEYVKFKDRWHLKHVILTEEFEHKNKPLYVNGEFLTTEFLIDSIKPIPFAERLNYRDIFLNIAKEYYSENYWEEYNVIQKDSLLNFRIKLLYDTSESKKLLTKTEGLKKDRKTYQIVSRISRSLGLCYLPFSAREDVFDLAYENAGKTINIQEKLPALNQIQNIELKLDYHMNNKWACHLAVSRSIQEALKMKSYDLGASYSILLNSWSKPLILDLSLNYTFTQFSRYFTNYTTDENYKIGSKTMDAETLRFGIGFNTNGLQPQVGLNYQFKNKIWLFAASSYFFPLYTSQKLYVAEKSGFILSRKRSAIKLSDNSLILKNNGLTTKSSGVEFDNYSLKMGIIFNF